MEEETADSEPSSPPPPPPPLLSWLWSPSSPAFRTTMGDMIGAESGDCMITDAEDLRAELSDQPRNVIIRRREMRRKRELPPPIALLRETGEMPWSLKREYSGDGRLIITAVPERVMRLVHECGIMEEDGRLTMRFITEEDSDCCEECGYPIDDEEEDLEFEEGYDSVDDEEEEECGFEFEEELVKEASNERERCGDLEILDLRECVTCDVTGPRPMEVVPLLKADLNTFLGQTTSSPLRPMTPVM